MAALGYPIWASLSTAIWAAGALACVAAACWLIGASRRYEGARGGLAAALIVTAGWAISGTIWGIEASQTALLDSARNITWLFAIYRMFAIDGRHESMTPVRPIVFSVIFVELLHTSAIAMLMRWGTPATDGMFVQGFATLGLLVSIGGLVLVHNLYGAASIRARAVLLWPASALAVLWAFELTYYSIAYLTGSSPAVLEGLRGGLGIAVAGLLAYGGRDGVEQLRLRPSRSAAFQSLSLLLIGGYLLSLAAVAQWLSLTGGDLAAQMQVGFLAIAGCATLTVMLSPRLRGWLRVSLAKNLFKHRYDYRAEWQRFTRTIGQGGTAGPSLEERAIRALADITESPGGLLLTGGEDGQFGLAARWQWPSPDVPFDAMARETVRAFEANAFVADLDALRSGVRQPLTAPTMPEWLLAEPRAWAAVPLLHFDRMVGLIVLARPAYARSLDWEDFDLLRVAGRQLASYLAENAGQKALAEAGRFDDFHRRIAFVMHDIKNLASQLSLLARNAEHHADNPAFRADMLVTLRNSADKLNTLLVRLSRYGATVNQLAPVRADTVATSVVGQYRDVHPVTLVESDPCEVAAERESLELVLVHLIQNAIDASAAESPIFVRVAPEGIHGVIEVIDSGSGMSAEFVRSRLFRPFDSTKPGGFGIGAYEARELIRAMGGRLDVESREGLGTRFIIRLPLSEAAELLKAFEQSGKKVA